MRAAKGRDGSQLALKGEGLPDRVREKEFEFAFWFTN